jgi:aryl-alcohol dehydrogenase-like predicted oxidoreductase
MNVHAANGAISCVRMQRASRSIGRPRRGAQRVRSSSSLQRLGVGIVDFLFTRAPADATPIEVTLEGLEAIRAGGPCP